MSLREIDVKVSYESSENKNELLEKFYIPLLQTSIKYYRVAGFFS